jgi:hypothetical protein
MPWITKLTGVVDPFPAYTTNIPQSALAALPSTPLDQALYHAWQATPSFNLVFPGIRAMGRDHVLVTTPSRSYTVGQQKELLQDMGDEIGVSALVRLLRQGCVWLSGVLTYIWHAYDARHAKVRVLGKPAMRC